MKKYTFAVVYNPYSTEEIEIITEKSEKEARAIAWEGKVKAKDNVESIEMVNVVSICSCCQKNPLGELPGLSRKDNKTSICSTCETQEAINEYYQ